MKRLKLMAVLAHPDDESLGFGGTLAKYSSEDIDTGPGAASTSVGTSCVWPHRAGDTAKRTIKVSLKSADDV